MNIDKIKRTGFGISLIVFPLMLLIGFLMHPHLMSLQPLETVEQLVDRFHHRPAYHIGHLIVMFAVPVIMISQISIMNVLQGQGKQLAFWGGITGLFGVFILAVDKGALCLVLSAFDTLPEAKFNDFKPFLSVIVDKEGLLWVVWLLPMLTIGAIIQAFGLLKERFISRWQGRCIIAGLLLLNNPDIELISSTGAVLMCAGYLPWGVRILQGRMRCSSVTCRIYQTKQNIYIKCPGACGL